MSKDADVVKELQASIRKDGFKGMAAAMETGRRVHQIATDRERGKK
jgi:hypothetical protein